MKLFLFLLGLVAAGLLGYSFEPLMREALTGKSPDAVYETPAKVVVEPVTPSIEIDPSTYSAEQLPEKVLLKAAAEISDAASGVKMSFPAGAKVSLVRLEGENAIISPGASLSKGSCPSVRPISWSNLPAFRKTRLRLRNRWLPLPLIPRRWRT